MAKRKSEERGKRGKSGKAERAAAVEPRAKNRIPRGVKKHLRNLERQLFDAARQERKRLRKLEKAMFRRQMIQAALEELRGETTILVATVEEAAAAENAPVTAPAPAAEPATPAAKPRAAAAARTRSPRASTAAPKDAPEPPAE